MKLMSDKIFTEENGVYQFDFSKAEWAMDDLNDIFHENKQIWCDADFVCGYMAGAKDEKINLLLVEYKNANIDAAKKHTALFNPLLDKKVNNVARKYLDSLSYLLAVEPCEGKKKYVYIVEAPNSDSTTRKLLREKIAAKLPFQFQKQPQFKEKLIDEFEVLSIDEWNHHQQYAQFPISEK